MLQLVKNIIAQIKTIRERNVTIMEHKSEKKQKFDTKQNFN